MPEIALNAAHRSAAAAPAAAAAAMASAAAVLLLLLGSVLIRSCSVGSGREIRGLLFNAVGVVPRIATGGDSSLVGELVGEIMSVGIATAAAAASGEVSGRSQPMCAATACICSAAVRAPGGL